jgi:hypothetical protein
MSLISAGKNYEYGTDNCVENHEPCGDRRHVADRRLLDPCSVIHLNFPMFIGLARLVVTVS